MKVYMYIEQNYVYRKTKHFEISKKPRSKGKSDFRFKFLISDINKNIKIFLYYILKTYINRYF